jgi:hypothetical protein
MTMLGTFTKQPHEVLDYDIVADEWLSDDDSILTAVTVAPIGITVDNTDIQAPGRVVKVWISGGESGQTYKLQVTMTTQAGRIKEAEFKIKVREV